MTIRIETVTPYLCARDAAAALDFYKTVFGAEELFRLTDPGDGRIGHAEFRIGETLLFLADEYPDFGAIGPDTLGGSPVSLHVQVSDCDAVIAGAEAAGALVRCAEDRRSRTGRDAAALGGRHRRLNRYLPGKRSRTF